MSPSVPIVSRLLQLPLDLLPEPGPPVPGSRLLRPRTRGFVGRVSDMQRVAAALAESRIVCVVGEPGVGKSALAAEFAHRYGRYFAGGVFWLECSVAEAIPFQIAACGRAMGLRSDFSRLGLDEQVRAVLGAWQGDAPRLVVFDGAVAPLREWLPARGGASVLITGQRPEREDVASLRLGPLPREHAVALLREGPPAELGPLAQELGDLPLALRLAAAAVQAGLTVQDYRRRLAASGAVAGPGSDQRGRLGALFRRRESAPSGRPVAAAFAAVLPELGTRARAALGAAARLAPEPFPPFLLGEAGGDLLRLGLLEDEEGWWRLHPLLAEQVRQLDAAPIAAALADWARRTESAEDRLRVLPHLVVMSAGGETPALEAELGSCLWRLGDGASARPHLERALEFRDHSLGSEDVESLAGLVELGALLRSQGDLGRARECLEEALQRGRRLGNAPEMLRATEELGWTLQAQGESDAARACLKRVVAALASAGGTAEAEARYRLGVLLREQGDLAGSREALERALAGFQTNLGAEDPRGLACLSDLGLVRRDQGDLIGAADCLGRALELSERTRGADHPDTAALLDALGTVLQARGDREGARRHLERALAIRERSFGPDHPITAQSLSSLGLLLRESGDLEGARQCLERALVVSQRVLGPYDPQTATSLSHLGTVLRAQGELVEAQPYLERAVAIREQALGADHPETASSLHDLGALLIQQGDLVGARTYLERALEIREQTLPPDHPDTAATRHALGTLLWQLGDPGSGLVYLEQAVAIRERVLGPDHPETLDSIRNLDALRAVLASPHSEGVGLGEGVGLEPDPSDEGPLKGRW